MDRIKRGINSIRAFEGFISISEIQIYEYHKVQNT